jgi:hypothetical protein
MRRPGRGRSRGPVLAALVSLGVVLFAAGFLLLWSLGSWLVGGSGFPGAGGDGTSAPTALVPAADYTLEPLVDPRVFRDLSYVPVKGLYVSSYGAGNEELFGRVLGIADRTEINALVIDVKDDFGKVTYDADVPLAVSLGLIEPRIQDIEGLIATLREHDITPIARLVCFKDNDLARKRPDLAVQSSKGGVWQDRKGLRYTNPYNREVWEYNVQVAEDAVRRGFREIQFDYTRFPSDGPVQEAVYPGEYTTKEDAIAAFLAFARERLEPLGVWVSVDVFGVTVHVKDDQGIGQQLEKMARNVDLICPMVYPSHYGKGYYGLDDPNADPYQLVKNALADAATRLAGTGAKGRPWLQDFSLGGVQYGEKEVRAEIRAAEEQGFDEWMLWDPALKYVEAALRPAGG